MKHMLAYIIGLFICISHLHAIPEKPIVVVIPSWNNIRVCADNLKSVFCQKYDNYHIIYIDDCSTDGTGDAVQQLIQEYKQQKRCTLIRNKKRRGIMYNHYMAVHSCPNNVIIVNLDGDDQFAHDKVLQRINEAYQNDNVWMTYGQYLEWPNKQWPKGKLGICRKIPNVIHAQQAYRYYDWITSHPRTFYAGLFKAIPLGYFLHNGQFQPSAVDFAMMYSMLELSKGRVQFIDEILYYYNCENPNNVFRTMILTDMAMGYISRGREPLEPLTYDPRRPEVGNTSNASLAIVCLCGVDKEKTQKLCTSLLSSSLTMHDIYILYETAIDAFEQLHNKLKSHNRLCEAIDITKQPITDVLLQICTAQQYTHILLLTDDYSIMDAEINIPDMIRLLEKTHAMGFYGALAKHYTPTKYPTIEQPQLVECEPGVYAWKFNKASGPWRFAYTTDCALYPIKDVYNHIQGIPCTTKQELRELLHSYAASHTEDVGICYEHALCA